MPSGVELVVAGGTGPVGKDAVSVPVIALGWTGKHEHLLEGVIMGGAEVLLAASVYHYRILSIWQFKEYLQKGLRVHL